MVRDAFINKTGIRKGDKRLKERELELKRKEKKNFAANLLTRTTFNIQITRARKTSLIARRY